MIEARLSASTPEAGVAVFDPNQRLDWWTPAIDLLLGARPPFRGMDLGAFREAIGRNRTRDATGADAGIRETAHRRDDGRLVLAYADVSDLVTELERSRQESAFFQTLLDFVPAIIGARDEDGLFKFANQATLDEVGLTRGDLVGRRIGDVFPAEVSSSFLARDAQAISRPGEIFDEVEIVYVDAADGQYGRIETTGEQHVRTRTLAPGSLWDGKPWVICVSEVVTDTVLAGRALETAVKAAEDANGAKSAFVATMSHEIRTPLNGILGMAQAMAQEKLPSVQRGRLEVIQQSGESLLAILNDILDLSKIEAGMLTLEAVDFDIEDLARGAYSTFTALANKKGLSFALTIEPEARGLYRGDSVRIRQILYNLVSNALKFTDQGEVRVTLSARSEALVLSVADTGMGIPADRLSALFERFVQADASTTRRHGGTGLGLAICRELAEMMNGSIGATSEPDRGSRFTVTLPLPRADPNILRSDLRKGEASDVAEDPEVSIVGMRVLAAEDNAINQLVLKTLLHQFGIDPVLVDNGRQALDAWRREPWDLVLMDIQMPELDGVSATRAIRGLEATEDLAPTPIVGLTANVMAHQVSEYREAGFDEVVAKPIEVRRLYDVLCAVEARRRRAESQPRSDIEQPPERSASRA